MNQKILLQKVNGELSAEDFAVLKETVNQQKADLEEQIKAMDAETSTMNILMEEKERQIVNLVKVWRESDTAQKQELAFALFPGGLRFSQETKYFEPHNTLLMNGVEEMISHLLAQNNVGVPGGI